MSSRGRQPARRSLAPTRAAIWGEDYPMKPLALEPLSAPLTPRATGPAGPCLAATYVSGLGMRSDANPRSAPDQWREPCPTLLELHLWRYPDATTRLENLGRLYSRTLASDISKRHNNQTIHNVVRNGLLGQRTPVGRGWQLHDRSSVMP